MTMFHNNDNTMASPRRATTRQGAWERNRPGGADAHLHTPKQAKKLILAEWKDWSGKTGDKSGHDKVAFYEWLKEFRSDHLDFPAEVDRWQIINVWLSSW